MTREFKGTMRFGSRVEVDPNRCKAEMYTNLTFHQCGNKPKRDGWCGIHHPDADARRRSQIEAKQMERLNKVRLSNLAHDFRAECVDAVKKIAVGHNDPQGLCQEIVIKYREAIK